MAKKAQETKQGVETQAPAEAQAPEAENYDNQPLVQLTGLWINKSQKDGSIYFTGYMGSARVRVFKNKYKKNENHPDYVLYVTPPKPEKESDDTPNDFEKSLDDIPF
jgi:hypothetical protein